MALRGLYGLVRRRGCSRSGHLDNRRGRCGLLGNGSFLHHRRGRFGFCGLFFGSYGLLLFGLLVVKFPRKVCVYGDHTAVLLGNLRNVVGIQLKGHSGFFLAQIFTDQAAADQVFGGIKGILLLVIDRFDIDGREPLLLACALNQLQCQRELAGGIDLVKEGSLRVLFLASHVASVIHGVLQRCRIERQVQIQRTGAHVDFRDLRTVVAVIVDRPRDAVLCALICEQCVFDCAVILFDVGTGLDQLCLKALAIVCHDIATRLLVKADDALVAREQVAFVLIVTVAVLLRIALCIRIVLVLCIKLLNFLDVLVLFLRVRKGGDALVILHSGIFHRHLMLGTKLRADFHQFCDRLENLLSRGAVTLLCLCRRRGRGGRGLLDDLLVGFGDVFFNIRHLSARICRAVYGDSACRGCLSNRRLCLRNHGNGCRLLCRSLLRRLLGNDRLLRHSVVGYGLLLKGLLGNIRLLHLLLALIGYIRIRIFLLRRFLYGLLLRRCFRLGSTLLHGLLERRAGNKHVSLGKENDQNNSEHQSADRRQNRQCEKRHLGRQRNRSERQGGDCEVSGSVVCMTAVQLILQLVLQLVPMGVLHFSDQNANAGNLRAKQACQYGDRDQKGTFHAQSQIRCRCKNVLKIQDFVLRSFYCSAARSQNRNLDRRQESILYFNTKEIKFQYVHRKNFPFFTGFYRNFRHCTARKGKVLQKAGSRAFFSRGSSLFQRFFPTSRRGIIEPSSKSDDLSDGEQQCVAQAEDRRHVTFRALSGQIGTHRQALRKPRHSLRAKHRHPAAKRRKRVLRFHKPLPYLPQIRKRTDLRGNRLCLIQRPPAGIDLLSYGKQRQNRILQFVLRILHVQQKTTHKSICPLSVSESDVARRKAVRQRANFFLNSAQSVRTRARTCGKIAYKHVCTCPRLRHRLRTQTRKLPRSLHGFAKLSVLQKRNTVPHSVPTVCAYRQI